MARGSWCWYSCGYSEGFGGTAYDAFLHGNEAEARWHDEAAPDASHPAFVEAQRAYEKAVELDPAFAAAWTNLGGLMAASGDLDSARDYFDQALSCDPDQEEARCNLAELALRDGDFDLAIEGFRVVLSNDPDHLEAHYGLARQDAEKLDRMPAAWMQEMFPAVARVALRRELGP